MPAAFRRRLLDLCQRGLARFGAGEVSETPGNEFYVRLVNGPAGGHAATRALDRAGYYTGRQTLLREVGAEPAVNAGGTPRDDARLRMGRLRRRLARVPALAALHRRIRA